MEAYSLLFWDSFRAMFVFSLSGETLWNAAYSFHQLPLINIVAASFLGGMFGALSSIAIGYAVSSLQGRLFTVDEELYDEMHKKASKYGIYIFLIQKLPFVQVFFFFAGVLRVPLRRLIIVALAGRALFFIYYLFIADLIPSF